MRSPRLRRLVAAIRPGSAKGCWQPSFRAHVIALVIASVLPLAGLGIYSMLRLAAAERAADESQILGTARAVAATIEHNFHHHLTTLRALAARFPRDDADLQNFYGDCAAQAAENGGWIFLADSDGRQIFNSRRPFGTALPTVAPTREFSEAATSGEPRISSLHSGMIDTQLQVTIYLPIVEDGSVRRVLGFIFPTHTLNALLRDQQLPKEWVVSAIDRNGTIVAKPDDAAPLLGKQTSPEILALSARQGEGFLYVTHSLGVPVYMGVTRLELSGWTVVVGIPTAIVNAPLYQTLWRFGILGGALLALALGAAAFIGSHLAKAMNGLASTAHALAGHEPMPAVTSTVREVNQAARALHDAGEALSKSEAQLRRGQQHLLQAQHVASLGSVEYDLKTDAFECSDEIYRIFGVDRTSFVLNRQSMLELIHPEDRSLVNDALAAVRPDAEQHSMEYRIIRPSGEIRTVRREAELISDESGEARRLFVTILDITKQRAAEERQRQLEQKLLYAQQHEAARLRESEARLSRSQQHLALAQRISQTGSVLYDIALGTDEWSDELYRITGLKRGEQPEALESFLALVPEDEHERLAKAKAALLQGARLEPMQCHIRRPDGEVRVLQIDVEPLNEEEGRPNIAVVAIRDITELRAAETQLRRSQQHLALAQRVSQTGSVLYDIAKETEEWSDELYRINGLKRGEQPETFASVLALVPEEDRAKFAAVKASLQRGEVPAPIQYRLRRPDGQLRVIQLDVAPLGEDEGPLQQVVVSLRDVTELRATEEQLRRSQQHLALAQRVSQTGSVMHDIKSNISEWSDDLYPILGLQKGVTPPTFESFIAVVHEEDRAALIESQQALTRGERRSEPEYRIVHPDGTLRMIHTEVETLFDDSGQPERLVITFHDVTKLRAAEERERNLERQLLHAQKLEALGTLAGGVAHDLNNTLVPVLGLAKLTMKRLPEGSREQANLAIILKAGERARDLVRQILAFSRKDAPTRQAVDLAALLRDSLRMLASSLPATIRIEEAIGEVPLVSADPGQLHQILINLMVNAAHAIGDNIGKILVSLDAEPHPLPDASGQNTVVPTTHIAVQDTGCGMDEATRQRIFEPFFTTKAVGEGTGLGLSVVHGIIVQHGGRITVESRLGEGTRFDVYLPALSGEEEARQLETAALAI